MDDNAIKRFFSNGALYCVPACVVACIWIFVASEISDVFARWNLDLFSAGLLVVVPALLMTPGRGFLVVFVCGMLFDVSLPIPFEKMETAIGGSAANISLFGEMPLEVPPTLGFTTVWMAIFYFALRFLRSRIDLTLPRHWLVCAVSVNFVIFLLWSIAMGWENAGSLRFWSAFAIQAAVSSLVVAALGLWFFDATLSLYKICGRDLIAEREVGDE